MCECVDLCACFFIHTCVLVCNNVCVCLSANANECRFLPSASLELNVKVITCVCDSPLSQVLSLCSHMQLANQESTVCTHTHTHTHTQLHDTWQKNGTYPMATYSPTDIPDIPQMNWRNHHPTPNTKQAHFAPLKSRPILILIFTISTLFCLIPF